MDQPRPDGPGFPEREQGDPSVQDRGRAFVRSTVVTWIAVIVGFAAS